MATFADAAPAKRLAQRVIDVSNKYVFTSEYNDRRFADKQLT
jgi:hypothetical protein